MSSTYKLNDFEVYEIDGEAYSLNELKEFIKIAIKEEGNTNPPNPIFNEITEFFEHGEEVMKDHGYNAIVCTENGTIAFINQYKMIACIMRYGGIIGDGFSVMQYCTLNNTKWHDKIIWQSELYWKTLEDSFEEVKA